MTDQRKASRSNKGSTAWSGPWLGEALDRRLTGLGVHAGVAHLLGAHRKAIVEPLEAGDALGLGLSEKGLANEAIEALLFATALGISG
jgi:hypothetical protein